MEFRSEKDITRYLTENGIFLRRQNGGSKLFVKKSDKPNQSLQLREVEEKRLIRFITCNTSNPYIDFGKTGNNIRIFAESIDFNVINNYLKEQMSIRKVKQLHDELQKYDFVYVIRKDQYYQINNDNQKGLFLTDEQLIPDDAKILKSQAYLEYIKKAASLDEVFNEHEDSYEKEMGKFNKIAICEFEK